MASIIRIKRSETSGNPSTLAAGELAYSALPDNGANGGDRLYIGSGVETSGDAANHIVIGGKFFTDMLDHTKGTLTASSALVVDANSKLDNIKIDNIDINGNTISSTDTNGNIVLDPNGTGIISVSSARITNLATPTDGADAATKQYVDDIIGGDTIQLDIAGDTGTGDITLSDSALSISGGTGLSTSASGSTITVRIDDTGVVAGSYGSSTEIPVFSVNAQGQIDSVGTVAIGANLDIAGDTGTDTVNLLDDTLSINGGDAIDVSVTDNTISISVVDGEVTNAKLQNSSVTVGSTEIALGATSTSIAGLTELTVDNININGNTVTATNTDGDVVLDPNGTGTVDVNGSRITTVADPVSEQDAANKRYVDEVAQGLSVKPAVHAATTADLSATYDNGTSGVGATLNLGPAATLSIDGVTTWEEFDGVLVKDQTNAWENGRYYVSQVGGASTDWILTRCGACDETSEIPSMYVFVQEGTLYADTGWVATVDNVGDFTVGATDGTGDITFTQFSGAGTYQAGDALSLDGNEFNVNVSATGGIEINADALQLKSTVAGDGLTYSSGVINAAGTTNRISVSADAIDIADTYIGQTSITTVGTIATGTWQANAVDELYGGTGHTTYATGDLLYASAANTLSKRAIGTAGQVLQVNGSGVPVWGDLDGGTY